MVECSSPVQNCRPKYARLPRIDIGHPVNDIKSSITAYLLLIWTTNIIRVQGNGDINDIGNLVHQGNQVRLTLPNFSRDSRLVDHRVTL